MPSDTVLYQAAALCLTYPGEDFHARLPLLREAAPQLRGFTDHAAVTEPAELAAHYLRVFDMERGHSLYLSRWQSGGSGPDAASAGRFEDAYRAHGLDVGEERPDFLPAVLEFTARTGETGLLTEHRTTLERLRGRLTEDGTPYACVLDAVCAALPTVHHP
ncbi:nitrate reductase molybdenum cofactor assembly chaperone [Streptomyces mangrovisoli]|uniref:Nitrate reductase n=1 Tax=Streptomyces mangrovisoli TaxID=1428628 RepID=A0A1J4P334_9ACTN|nr:molecular chaperone TorD family protein [Streptomyces mangrovisoli]OIJ67854.1 nitrate reductase [Streptomyces mangrovisoli]